MADITNEIQKIGQAVYGEEVRGAIMDALEAMNEETNNAEKWATGAGTDVPGGGDVPGTENNAEYWAGKAQEYAESVDANFLDTVKCVDGITDLGDAASLATYFSKRGIVLDGNNNPSIGTQNLLRLYAIPVVPGNAYRFTIGLPAPSSYYCAWMKTADAMDEFSAEDCVATFQNLTGNNPAIYIAPAEAHFCWYCVTIANAGMLVVNPIIVREEAVQKDPSIAALPEKVAELQSAQDKYMNYGGDSIFDPETAPITSGRGVKPTSDTTATSSSISSLFYTYFPVKPGHYYSFSHGVANPTSFGGGWLTANPSAQGATYVKTFLCDFNDTPRIMQAPENATYCVYTCRIEWEELLTVTEMVLNPYALPDVHDPVTGAINIDSLAPLSSGYYTLATALATLSNDMIGFGTIIMFREAATSIAYYRLEGVNAANFDGVSYTWKRNLNNWSRLNLGEIRDYEFGTKNRIANPDFTSYTKENITPVVLFDGYERNTHYRIPAVVVANDGSVIAVCEQRDNEASVADAGDYSICMRRLASGSEEWSDYAILRPFDANGLGRFMSSCFLTDRSGANSGTAGRIYLFNISCKDSSKRWYEQASVNDVDLTYIYTDDNGVTWSSSTSLKSTWDTAAYTVVCPAPSSGIVLTDETFVVPCFCWDGSHSRPILLIKPASGSWYMSNPAPCWANTNIDENAIFYRDGLVHMLTRNDLYDINSWPNNQNRGMYHYTYNISTGVWETGHSTFDPNDGCALCIIPSLYGSSDFLLMSGLDTTYARRFDLTLWASYDGEKWLRIYRINTGKTQGYSYLSFYNGKLVTLYEGPSQTAHQISYQDISSIRSKIPSMLQSYVAGNVSIQDLLQKLINKIYEID